MPADTVTTLLLGDVYGQPGCRVLFCKLNSLKKDLKADLVIVNGENAFDGFGMSEENADTLFNAGADVITSGNHIWQNEEIYSYLDRKDNLLRPANFGATAPGHGSCIVNGVGVINLHGRVDLKPIDDPFKCAADLVNLLKTKTKTIIVDMHAESPEEKEALAYFLDGNVTAVLGTHTHVQTADERILPKGTAYISDVGMCGPRQSVIGSNPELAIKRMKTMLPIKARPLDTPAQINGVLIVSDAKTGRALSIKRITE